MHSKPYPPKVRSHAARGLLRGVAAGQLTLQVCAACGESQYPPREACRACLGDDLIWRQVASGGHVLATTLVRVSNEEFFQDRTPWQVVLVHADCGPRIVAHAYGGLRADQRVRIEPMADSSGSPVLVAVPEDTEGDRDSSGRPAEFDNRIAGRSVIVTDTTSVLGTEVVSALHARGVAEVVSPEGTGYTAVTNEDGTKLVLDTR